MSLFPLSMDFFIPIFVCKQTTTKNLFFSFFVFFSMSVLNIFGVLKGQNIFFYTPLALQVLQGITFASAAMSCPSANAGMYSVAFVTVPNSDVGTKISHGLVEKKLAACVNMIPGVKSVYMWEGKVNEDNELILKIKTRTCMVDKVTEFVKAMHPYDVCEVISMPITNGNSEYLKWIGESVPEA